MLDGYKTIIGALVALIVEAARLFGIEIGDSEGIASSIMVIIGAAIAIYGRIVARKDLRGGNLE